MDPQLVLICQSEDIEKLELLVNDGFLLYPHVKDIFHFIIEHEKTKLYHYIVKYIKTHPFNRLTGKLYAEHRYQITDYALFLLLKKEAKDAEIYDFIETHYKYDWELVIPTETIVKILDLNLSERILNVLKNISVSRDINNLQISNSYQNVIEEEIKNICSETIKLSVIPLIMYFHNYKFFDKHFWHLIRKLDDVKREKVFVSLEYLINDDCLELDEIIKLKDLSFVKSICTRFNTTLDLRAYANSCKLQDFDFSFTLLKEITEIDPDIKEDHFEENEKLKAFADYYDYDEGNVYNIFEKALSNAYKSCDLRLQEFNIKILKKLGRYSDRDIKCVNEIYKYKNEVCHFLQNSNRKIDVRFKSTHFTVGSHFASHFIGYKHDINKQINSFQKLLLRQEQKQTDFIFDSPFTGAEFSIYYLMSTGYRDLFQRIKFKYDEDKLFEILNNYFDKENIIIKIGLQDIKLFPVLTNIIYQYAKY